MRYVKAEGGGGGGEGGEGGRGWSGGEGRGGGVEELQYTIMTIRGMWVGGRGFALQVLGQGGGLSLPSNDKNGYTYS